MKTTCKNCDGQGSTDPATQCTVCQGSGVIESPVVEEGEAKTE
jgi:DnaJ-class molecular chaperone